MLIHDRFVFMHLQKTAGTFVADALRSEMPDGALTRGAPGKLHPGWDDIPASARGRPVLMYVRNPWDWYVSWYHFVRSNPTDGMVYRVLFGGGRNDFATTVRNACAGLVDARRPQRLRWTGRGEDFYSARFRDFCGAGLDAQLLDIRRYESLVDDLAQFLKQAGAPLSADAVARVRGGRRLKTTAHRPYREYYDRELRELVGRSCEMIVERFGYRF